MDRTVGLDTVWVLIAAFLVFFMQAGFGVAEAGFMRVRSSDGSANRLEFEHGDAGRTAC